MVNRPHVTVVLAMSLDGKLADYTRSAGRFGSPQDQAHLEERVAEVDAVLFGAGTLRAYGTTMSVHTPELQTQRTALGKPPQPIQIVCSASGKLDSEAHFFSQPVHRWLLTTTAGAKAWSDKHFERVWIVGEPIDWAIVLSELAAIGIEKLALLGGGKLVASFLEAGFIDEIWLTICPLILAGERSPTPVQCQGWLEANAPRLELLEVRTIVHEVFLHYRVK
jgi:5-amino-6-(5-phosphoribosylamino)uracil reductase